MGSGRGAQRGQPTASSSCAASASRRSSRPGGPTSWTPTGVPVGRARERQAHRRLAGDVPEPHEGAEADRVVGHACPGADAADLGGQARERGGDEDLVVAPAAEDAAGERPQALARLEVVDQRRRLASRSARRASPAREPRDRPAGRAAARRRARGAAHAGQVRRPARRERLVVPLGRPRRARRGRARRASRPHESPRSSPARRPARRAERSARGARRAAAALRAAACAYDCGAAAAPWRSPGS